MLRWLKSRSRADAPWHVASPSGALARVAAEALGGGSGGRDARSAPPGARVALVVSDPLLERVLEDGPVPPAVEWLERRCAELGIPASAATGGDFPFSEGRQILSASPREVVLTRFESLHLLGAKAPVPVAERIADGFASRLRSARFSEAEVGAAYADPVIGRLFRPFHRQMLARKWRGLPRRLPDGELIVYHHVPKCAGMSVFQHLNAHLAWNDELVHLDGRAERDVNAAGAVPFALKDSRELDRIEVLFGHDVSLACLDRLPGRRPLLATCLRDPAGRMVSHYNWEMHQRDLAGLELPGFGAWYASQEKNWMTRWLGRVLLGLDLKSMDEAALLGGVESALGRFWLVGMTRGVEETMQPLFEKLGLPALEAVSNRAGESYPRRMELTADWRERIDRDHPLDARLFRNHQPVS